MTPFIDAEVHTHPGIANDLLGDVGVTTQQQGELHRALMMDREQPLRTRDRHRLVGRSVRWSSHQQFFATYGATSEQTTFRFGWFISPVRRAPNTVYAMWYTFDMAKTVPVREFRSQLADLLDQVADRREHVTVTRHGRPAAVLIPVAEYLALEETAEILSDDAALEAIRQGLADLAADDVVSLDEVREEHAARKRS